MALGARGSTGNFSIVLPSRRRSDSALPGAIESKLVFFFLGVSAAARRPHNETYVVIFYANPSIS